MRERVSEISQKFAEMIRDDEFTQEEFYALYGTIYQTLRRQSTFGGENAEEKEKG